MKKIHYLCLFLLSVTLFTSCSGTDNDTILKFTTDKTLAISRINLAQFNDKLPKDQISKDTTISRMSKSEKEKFKLFMDAENNGIDIKKPLYIIVDEEKGNYVFSFLITLDDDKKFEENFSKISDKKITLDKDKSLVYADGNIIGSVHDDMIVISRMSNYGNYSYSGSSDSKVDEAFYKSFWNRKSNIDDNVTEQINTSLDKKSDLSAWINLHGVISAASKGYIETLAVNKLLVNAGFSVNFNFEEGKFVANTNSYFNDDLKKLVEKHYEGKDANFDILNSIDVDNAKSYGVGYMSFEFVKYFVKEAGFEASINHFLEDRDLTFAEIVDALNGDYAFVSYKDNMVVNDEMFGSYERPNTLFALGINGGKAKKIVDLLHQDNMLSSMGNIFNNNNIIAFASDENKLKLLQANKKAANTKLNKMSDVNGYSWTSGEEFNLMYSRVKQAKFKFEDVVSTSTVKNGNFATQTTISIDKKKKNSLHYLMGYE